MLPIKKIQNLALERKSIFMGTEGVEAVGRGRRGLRKYRRRDRRMPCSAKSQKPGGAWWKSGERTKGETERRKTYHNQCPNLQRQSEAIVIQAPLQNCRYKSSEKTCTGEKYAIRHPLPSNEPFIQIEEERIIQ